MFIAFQQAIFKKVSEHLRERYPHRTLNLAYADELILKDMEFLKANNKLRWDPSLKSRVFMDMMEEHPIKLVVYYRGEPVGFAFGCYCSEMSALHICWMEKRNDAHADLDHQMLGIVLETYSTYAAFIERQGYKVIKIAFVSPIEGSHKYYLDSGFEFDPLYYRGAGAMILPERPIIRPM